MTKKPDAVSQSQIPASARDANRGAIIESAPSSAVNEIALLADLRDLIRSARQRVATAANSTHTLLCWHVGRRLLKENLQDGRAAYGERILVTVSRELAAEFGNGFSYSSLTRMARFAEAMADQAIVATLSQELSWCIYSGRQLACLMLLVFHGRTSRP